MISSCPPHVIPPTELHKKGLLKKTKNVSHTFLLTLKQGFRFSEWFQWFRAVKHRGDESSAPLNCPSAVPQAHMSNMSVTVSPLLAD